MKRFFLLIALSVMLTVSVFAFTEGKTLKDVGIPYHVSYIEFWNGGTLIASYKNATVEIIVQSDKTLLSWTDNDNQIQFYIYKITCNGVVEKIIDSEALAIKYRE